MAYQYEALGDERFQQFAQALLVRNNPNIQCLPVGQPDGGRDAFLRMPRRSSKEFIVFQVKYVKQPFAMKDPHKWLLDTIKLEAPKISNLIQRGAKEYYLITNVQGTSHLDIGSIDRLQQILENNIDVPSQCWWRDDLDRRLDNAIDVKWAYPDVLSGRDVLHYILENGLSENREARTLAVKAYITKQFLDDQEVRFKQIDLQSNLLDLFIDVPINLRSVNSEKNRIRSFHSMIQQSLTDDDEIEISAEDISRLAIEELPLFIQERLGVGAASLLLNPIAQENLKNVVLEGGPGQGKSTITQYVCQVHRMRILEDKGFDSLPELHKTSAVRVPFKVDLRDLATWLSGQNPFILTDGIPVPLESHRTLEAFLSAQVAYLSGGMSFSVNDLVMVAKQTAMLLVLDGLDEIGDIAARKDVVYEIISGIKRLRNNSASLQVIVTSRPAAFSNSPGFPEKSFPHLELNSLTKKLISSYADKWIKMRNIPPQEARDIRDTLRTKLGQPHLRDLARNPMQLAILLSLIHTRGQSLPNKRTALYDAYIDLFFSREAEKNSDVRDHRNLLIDIHRYLAWVLHSQVENGDNSSGAIAEDDLHNLLTQYLKKEGQDSTLASKLFKSAIDRVCALVSRVEGTFEFEVQPLREYFAARFLYDTSPDSPIGSEKGGTWSDRYAAIARNFYWLNVGRFFAGCCRKGELASLADVLEELMHEEKYQHLSHPKILTAMLISDWVFEQEPKALRKALGLLLTREHLRYILDSRRNSNNVYLLTNSGIGKSELLQFCTSQLHDSTNSEYSSEIVELIKLNLGEAELRKWWLNETLNAEDMNRTKWIGYGLQLKTLRRSSSEDLKRLIENDKANSRQINYIFRSGNFEFFENEPELYNSILDSILDQCNIFSPTSKGELPSIIALISQVLNIFNYRITFFDGLTNDRFRDHLQSMPLMFSIQDVGFQDYLQSTPLMFSIQDIGNGYKEKKIPTDVLYKCENIITVAYEQYNLDINQWASQISPWESIIECLRQHWGERWSIFLLASLAAHHKVSSSDYDTASREINLLDTSLSLCTRVLHAKSKSKSSKWWSYQLSTATSELDLMFICLQLILRGNADVIRELIVPLDQAVSSLSPTNWGQLYSGTQKVGRESLFRKPIGQKIEPALKGMSDRTIALIASLLPQDVAASIFSTYLSNYSGTDLPINEFCDMQLSNRIEQTKTITLEDVNKIAHTNSLGIYNSLRHSTASTIQMTKEVAERILENPDTFPRYLLSLSETFVKNSLIDSVTPISIIADNDNWFRSTP